MGRLKSAVLGVTSVTLLGIALPTLAQEAAQQSNPAPSTTSKTMSRGPWKKVADGVWKAHIARFYDKKEGKEKPEFAVIRLTAANYAEFQKDHKKFLNDHKIFERDVNKQDTCTATEPQQQKTEDAYWYLVVSHWPGSSALCVAYPGWSEPQ